MRQQWRVQHGCVRDDISVHILVAHLDRATNTGEKMEVRRCAKCKAEKTVDQFHLNRGKNNKPYSWCKQCNHENVLERQKQFKKTLVDIKGGKCCRCGYSKCIGALEFHHKDPSQKDFGVSQYKCTSFEKNKEAILKELEKCDLLCANCHREAHYELKFELLSRRQ
jgi:hypothetical protein